MDSCEHKSSKLSLDSRLSKLGYFKRDEYNDLNFKLNKIEHYIVNKDFPVLKRKDLKKAIVRVNYTLSISAIASFKKEL